MGYNPPRPAAAAGLSRGIGASSKCLEAVPVPEFKGSVQLKKIYVGNLPFQLVDQDLMDLFAEFGEVNSAAVVLDRETGRSRGFGFVEMADDSAAMKAIESLNGKDIQGRALNVNEARPREPRNRPRW
jgi:cold-inducible RNA-binding protein